MRAPKNNWPDTDGSRGILMFAQLMSEMLTPTTFESFRVYSLDTNARVSEALELADDVRRQRIPKAALEPVIEEIEWSFGKDSTTKSLAANEIESFIRIIKDKNNLSLDKFSTHLKLIKKMTYNNYKSKTEAIILDLFDKPDRRIELRKMTGFYCSHLLNIGYSRNYVLQVINLYFFSTPILRTGRSTLSKFFKEFDGRIKKFIVTAAISKDLGTYLKGLGFSISDINTINQEQYETISNNENFSEMPFAFEIRVPHYDPHGAMDISYQILSAQRAISYLDPYGMKADWGSTMHVIRLRAKSGAGIAKIEFLKNRPRNRSTRTGFRPKTISNYAKDILSNFEQNSTERLISSIRTAALARTSLSPENQLISLWSAIEVLLSEPKEEARIVHYTSLVVPCVVIRHTRRQVFSVYEDLLIDYRSRLRKILRNIPSYQESHAGRSFANLMFLPEHAALRSDLCALLAKNPLALHRVWKLHNDYKDIKCTNRTITDHENRVNWQIHRIYRARNQLVHAGKMPSYLESVILNLAEYYRSAIATIVSRARMEENRSDIDQTVAEIGIRYGIFKNTFSGKQETALNLEQVSKLIDERSKINP